MTLTSTRRTIGAPAVKRSRPTLCAVSQVWDLMQVAYQLGISPAGERTHCEPCGARTWADLTAEDADALLWSLRAAILHDLNRGGHLVPPASRFYEPAQRAISAATVAWWRRHLRGEDNRIPPY